MSTPKPSHNPRNTKPIILYPFTPEEALRRAMNTKPPEKPASKAVKKKA